jgi:methylated-DNA-[protein]-cysteine S-methyltransferase
MTLRYNSPIGTIRVEYSERGISDLVFKDGPEMESLEIEMASQVTTQLDEYFLRKRTAFDLPLDIRGTDFQKKAWMELLKIPYGRTISYKELSFRVGNLKAIRAVGTANGANPISIIIPCHRVIGSDGSLTGYAGGLWRKKWLLHHESIDLYLL